MSRGLVLLRRFLTLPNGTLVLVFILNSLQTCTLHGRSGSVGAKVDATIFTPKRKGNQSNPNNQLTLKWPFLQPSVASVGIGLAFTYVHPT